ncbi:MAG: phage integrase SAM-like domain-containing protein, partial [Bacteroidaceae bacterium]|nr:phage integrase SAM-like domain-containing protein [Bacteroidaceae bacterium]
MIKHRYNWQLNKPKGNLLNFRVSWNNGHYHCRFSSGFSVDETRWSQDVQRCKANSTHPGNISAAVINRRISDFENAADNIFVEFYNKDILPTPEQFRTAFEAAIGRDSGNGGDNQRIPLRFAFRKFEAVVGTQNNWSDNTWKNFMTLYNHLQTFNSKLYTDELDKEQMQKFHNYLIAAHFNNNTIRKVFKSLRQFVRWLPDNGYHIGDAEQYAVRFKGLSDNHVVVYLTWDELQKLYRMHIKESYLARARDVFCFCCFTSLRYS